MGRNDSTIGTSLSPFAPEELLEKFQAHKGAMAQRYFWSIPFALQTWPREQAKCISTATMTSLEPGLLPALAKDLTCKSDHYFLNS